MHLAEQMGRYGRREFLRRLGGAGGALALGGHAATPERAPARQRSNAIYLIRMQGRSGVPGTVRRLSPDGYFIQPMLDARGASVLFWGRQDGETGFNLWRYDLEPRRSSKLTDDRALAGHPFWTADGRQLVYFSNAGVATDTDWNMDHQFDAGRSPRNLWIMDRDGGHRRRLTTGPHVDERPCITPDGRTVVFVSDRSGHQNLWQVNTATGELKQVTKHAGLDYRPVFSPDGRQLAFFTSNTPRGLHDLCLMQWPGGATSFPVRQGSFRWIHGPFWCADGRTILIHGHAAGDKTYALWLLELASRQVERIELPGIPAYAHGSLNADRSVLIFDSKHLL